MSDEFREGGGGGIAALLGVLLLVVLVFGGAGFYLFAERQQRVAAVMAEMGAKTQAEIARSAELQARAEAANIAAQRSAGEGESATGDENAIRDAVVSVLGEQREAWNRGDVDAFVEHYWNSEDLTFSSRGKTTRGFGETVRGYKERYPTSEAMGQLAFDNVEVTPLGDAAALVLGEWRLERGGQSEAAAAPDGEKVGEDTQPTELEPIGGNFTLVFRKLDGRWVIVHDHTSRAEE